MLVKTTNFSSRLEERLGKLTFSKKLKWIFYLFGFLGFSSILMSLISIFILSGLRSYVVGEGLWSKYQKDSSYYLLKYSISKNIQDYNEFKKALSIPMADKQGRLEIEKPYLEYDYDKAMKFLVKGKNHPTDIWKMIIIFRYFAWIPDVENIIRIWREADVLLEKQKALGKSLYLLYQLNQSYSQDEITKITLELESNNKSLMKLENEFSNSLSETSRLFSLLILIFQLGLTVLVLAQGFVFLKFIRRQTATRLKRLEQATKIISEGGDTKLYDSAEDEIGNLTRAFMQMVDKRQLIESQLEETVNKLEVKHRHLEQFISCIAHDMSEPVRLMGFNAAMIKEEMKSDEYLLEYIDEIESMGGEATNIISKLLLYSRLVNTNHGEEVSFEFILEELRKINGIKLAINVKQLEEVIFCSHSVHTLLQIIFMDIEKEKTDPIDVKLSIDHNNKEVKIGLEFSKESHVENIIQYFQHQTNRLGAGINWVLVEAILNKHDGRIEVDTESKINKIMISLKRNKG